MKLISTSIIFLIIVISNNLFLFNEEFLIFLSFSAFCFLVHERLNPTIQALFQDKILLVKTVTLDSLDSVYLNLLNKKKLNKDLKDFKLLFGYLRSYYLSLSRVFLNNLLSYLNNSEKSSILAKLFIFHRIEKEYIKLIFLLINRKISLISFLIKFFSKNLNIKKFKTISIINKLYLIKKI
nr:ATP synthase F1 subunit 4 [Neorhodomela munita]